MSDCICKHICILCVHNSEFQSACPCTLCLIKAICETKCTPWYKYWSDKKIKKKMSMGELNELYNELRRKSRNL